LITAAQAFLVCTCTGYDGFDSFRHQQLETEQPHWARPRDQGSFATAHLGNFGDRLHHGRKGFAHRCFIEREIFGNSVELVRTHDHVAGKRPIDPVPHASATGAENEISRAAVLALTTGNGGSAQTRDSFSYGGVGDLPAHFDDRP
jgi:hypothetical protein